jgi:hypothetical protein
MRRIVSIGLGTVVGNYPDVCDLCGRPLDYSPKRLVTFDDGSKEILCICGDCRDRLVPELPVKCVNCRYYSKRDSDIMGRCYRWSTGALLVSEWDSCSRFEPKEGER